MVTTNMRPVPDKNSFEGKVTLCMKGSGKLFLYTYNALSLIDEKAWWVAKAWLGILSTMSVNAFKKYAIFNAAGDTEDEIVWLVECGQEFERDSEGSSGE